MNGQTETVHPSAPREFSIADAATVLNQHTSLITTLWGFYTAAAWAFAGYGLTSKLGIGTVAMVTVGYWTFTLGHLALLRMSLRVQAAAAADLEQMKSSNAGGFKQTISALGSHVSSLPASIAAHLIVDLAATGAIWYRTLTS